MKLEITLLRAIQITFILGAGLASNAFAGGSSTVGPGNPIAIYCVKSGGKYSPAGYCSFGKANINVWTLRTDSPTIAVTQFFNATENHAKEEEAARNGHANIDYASFPAPEVYCRALGGKINFLTKLDDSETDQVQGIETCLFSDQSEIGISTLFKGDIDPENSELARVLKEKRTTNK